jgi:RNA polymerase sigma-70 factor, ECF subfamily
MQTETDEAIVKRVQSGDIESFGVLVERYEGKFKRYARRFLMGPDDTDDLVQDVFLHAYQNIQSVDTSRKFSSWIYRIAHNAFVNALRKRERYRASFIDIDTILPALGGGEPTDDTAIRSEEKTMLEKALSAVDKKYREVLVLYYFEELGYAEIADVLGIPIATVGVRLRRGRERAREAIRDIDPGYEHHTTTP